MRWRATCSIGSRRPRKCPGANRSAEPRVVPAALGAEAVAAMSDAEIEALSAFPAG